MGISESVVVYRFPAEYSYVRQMCLGTPLCSMAGHQVDGYRSHIHALLILPHISEGKVVVNAIVNARLTCSNVHTRKNRERNTIETSLG